MNKGKLRGEISFEVVHCPFEGRVELYHQIQPDVRWQLERPMYHFKNSFSFILSLFIEHKMFFQEHVVFCRYQKDLAQSEIIKMDTKESLNHLGPKSFM